MYPVDVRRLLADPAARASDIDAALTKHVPEWLAWEVPSLLLELERGDAPVDRHNQARIRGLYALHLGGECLVAPAAFEAQAWLFSGTEAQGMTPHPVDLLHTLDVVRDIAAAHGEPPVTYDPTVTHRIAEVCRQEGYIALPDKYSDVQAVIREGLPDYGLEIEKKARTLARSALSFDKNASHTPFPETPEGVAAARCAALEITLRR